MRCILKVLYVLLYIFKILIYIVKNTAQLMSKIYICILVYQNLLHLSWTIYPYFCILARKWNKNKLKKTPFYPPLALKLKVTFLSMDLFYSYSLWSFSFAVNSELLFSKVEILNIFTVLETFLGDEVQISFW